VGEANISILLAQLCDLTYSPKNSAQEVRLNLRLFFSR